MELTMAEVVFLQKVAEPARGPLGRHGGTILPGKNPALFILACQQPGLGVAVSSKHLYTIRRDSHLADASLCLWGLGADFPAGKLVIAFRNSNNAGLEVYVVPGQGKEFAPAASGQDSQVDQKLVLEGFLFQMAEHFLGFFLSKYICLGIVGGGELNPFRIGGVGMDHSQLIGASQNGLQNDKISSDRTCRKGFHLPAVGKARALELLDKHLDMERADFRKPEMSQNREDILVYNPFIGGIGDRGKHFRRDFQILGAEIAKADAAGIQKFAVFHSGFKDNGKTVDFLLNLAGGHTWDWTISFSFPNLFAV